MKMLIFIASDYKGIISPGEFTYCQAVIIHMKGLDKYVVCFQLLASASRTLCPGFELKPTAYVGCSGGSTHS